MRMYHFIDKTAYNQMVGSRKADFLSTYAEVL
jgi:hypothetical protein